MSLSKASKTHTWLKRSLCAFPISNFTSSLINVNTHWLLAVFLTPWRSTLNCWLFPPAHAIHVGNERIDRGPVYHSVHRELLHNGLWFLHLHLCPCVLCLCRIVCQMAAATERSAPGPVKLCVGECRPELRAQSSQLYSFVVSLPLKAHLLCPFVLKQTQSPG